MRAHWPRALMTMAVLLASLASAQSDPFLRGIDSVPIKLTPSMHSLLTLDGAELEPTQSWHLGALFDFNVGVLALKLGDQRLGDLIPLRSDLHLYGAFQVHPRVELAADLPITFLQIANFNLLTDQGFAQENPRIAGLGAPRLFARVQILKQSEVPIVGLAAIVEARLPFGDQFSFLSDRGVVFAPRLAVERTFGPVRLVANLGWRLRTAVGQYLNLYVSHEFTLGGGAAIALPDVWHFKRPELLAEINVATPAEAPFTFRDAEALKTPFELMIGARSYLTEHLKLLLSVGKGLGSNGYGRETIRFSVGISWESIPEPDRDLDGIPDRIDGCPEIAEDKDGYQDEDGCPEENPHDKDGDTVPDKVDQCPEVPGPVQLDGCPDTDGDQIPDISDKCPDKPGPPDREGCPPPVEEEDVVLESERIRINNQILFEFGSDRIAAQSFPLLDDVAKVLNEHPDVGPVMIEGHTDNVGPRSFNLDLSKRRARSVENYLVGKAVARERLRSDGFGFDRPIAPNDTPINRAKNRRTEFKLLEEIEKTGNPQVIPKTPAAPSKDVKPAETTGKKPAP